MTYARRPSSRNSRPTPSSATRPNHFPINRARLASSEASGMSGPQSARDDGFANDGQVAFGWSDVDLSRPRDLLLRIQQALLPLCQPAWRATDGEQHREHLHRKPDGGIDDARVEVDVWIQAMLDEIVIRQGDPLHLQRDIEERAAAGDRQHIVGNLLDDAGPRVVILVDAVTESHQPEFAGPHPFDVLGNPADRPDLL